MDADQPGTDECYIPRQKEIVMGWAKETAAVSRAEAPILTVLRKSSQGVTPREPPPPERFVKTVECAAAGPGADQ